MKDERSKWSPQGRTPTIYNKFKFKRVTVVYSYCLQEKGYTQFIGYHTGPMYWRRGDGQIYNRKNKYNIRCGFSKMFRYPHLEECPNWVPPHQVCTVRQHGDHLHPLPTREELIDQLLRWKIKITQYINPKWNNEKVLQDVYETWPFHLPYNPKYLPNKKKVHFKHRGNKRSGQDQQGIAGLFRTGSRWWMWRNHRHVGRRE